MQHAFTQSALAAIVAGLLLINSSLVYAADQSLGHVFATDNCARCHAIGQTGNSPYAKAPPFRAVARKYPLEDLSEALAEGIVTGHNTMPEFTLSTRQIDDLLAYLDTLK